MICLSCPPVDLSCESKKKFTPKRNHLHLKFSNKRKVIIHVLKKCYIRNRLVSSVCSMCSRLDEQEALFARVQKLSTCTKALKWDNELEVSNEMHYISFVQKQSHTHTHTHTHAHTHTHTHAHKCSWIFDMCGMINFARDVIWICKDRINTQIQIGFSSNIT